MAIRFRAMRAIMYVCPVCQERFVGGETTEDEQSAKWVNMHGDWHDTDGNQSAPPEHVRSLYGFIGVGV
jgi:hypothetical protein